ncbi:MAG: hypothetical protein IJS22_00710 [Lachnospiraceae bacterium]|nr:hypothetical protein [Lachnospiraceae bacterium]
MNERNGTEYRCPQDDRVLLCEMMKEINTNLGTDFRYIAEIDACDISGSGRIMVGYFNRFQSESVRAYLIPQIVSDQVPRCEEIIFLGYLHFKQSDEYISEVGKPAPAHIYVRYDNAFRRLKPRRLKTELFNLISNPRDAFYLPLTTRMLASWKLSGLECVLISYMNGAKYEDAGLPNDTEGYFPPLHFINRELCFTAIDALKYYVSEANLSVIKKYIDSPDKDIANAARKSFDYMKKKDGIKGD